MTKKEIKLLLQAKAECEAKYYVWDEEEKLISEKVLKIAMNNIKYLNFDGDIDIEDIDNLLGQVADYVTDIEEHIENDTEYSDSKKYYTLLIESMGDTYRRNATEVPLLSIILYAFYKNDIFYPVLFATDFDEFIRRCQLLGIELPELPPQKDAYERCMLYLDICCKLEEFREENELTKQEVCALIYDIAPEILEDEDNSLCLMESLPAPTRIWITGASKEDIKSGYIDKPMALWAGNEETAIGDIVIIYALAPYSCIYAVGRAVRTANFNPFDYYCQRIVIGDKQKVPAITFKDLKADPYMSQVPIVRKNLQGVNGWELQYDDYARLLEMWQERGMDISTLPQIEQPNINLNVTIHNEKDVEEQLLIPLLTQLGYSDVKGVDWDRQVNIKLGRKEKYIPDFVFFPQELSSRQVKAPFIIEAKHDFHNSRQLQKDFNQGVSYARPLEATLMGICDQHQLRIYRKSKQGLFTEEGLVFSHYWGEIQRPEIFNELQKLIGKEAIKKLI